MIIFFLMRSLVPSEAGVPGPTKKLHRVLHRRHQMADPASVDADLSQTVDRAKAADYCGGSNLDRQTGAVIGRLS
jgi:hypothetical protein